MPPARWAAAERESQELLAVCLKRMGPALQGGLRIVDAGFIWTEEHSKRIKVHVTVQGSIGPAGGGPQSGGLGSNEADANQLVMTQTAVVEFVVRSQQCADCKKSFTPHTWRGLVQLRQKVRHRRTFLLLEQLIVKSRATADAVNARATKDGMDFFFATRSDADRFVDFVKGAVPVRLKTSSKLISLNEHTSTAQVSHTSSVEIVPICKDDLVVLPPKLARESRNIFPVALCYRVGSSVQLVDPQTLDTADISAEKFWKTPFAALADSEDMTRFVVLDIERSGRVHGKWHLADVTLMRESDMGVSDTMYFARTHLGNDLVAGDTVRGYLLAGANFNNAFLDEVLAHPVMGGRVPDVVLARKEYPRRRRNRRRWALRRLQVEEPELAPRKGEQARMDREYEMFLRDVEEDPEMRAAMALYKAPGGDDASMAGAAEDGDEEDGDAPKIDMGELLDGFDELAINDEAQQ